MKEEYIEESNDKRSRHSKGFYTTGAGGKRTSRAMEKKEHVAKKMKEKKPEYHSNKEDKLVSLREYKYKK